LASVCLQIILWLRNTNNVQARRQDATPDNDNRCTLVESGTPPQVDGDVYRV
jgi:hypothetical protein